MPNGVASCFLWELHDRWVDWFGGCEKGPAINSQHDHHHEPFATTTIIINNNNNNWNKNNNNHLFQSQNRCFLFWLLIDHGLWRKSLQINHQVAPTKIPTEPWTTCYAADELSKSAHMNYHELHIWEKNTLRAKFFFCGKFVITTGREVTIYENNTINTFIKTIGNHREPLKKWKHEFLMHLLFYFKFTFTKRKNKHYHLPISDAVRDFWGRDGLVNRPDLPPGPHIHLQIHKDLIGPY